MRFLIVAAAVFACAAAAPSGALLATSYAAPQALAAAPVAVAHAAAVVAPTIPPGDLHGAAIDAHVSAVDQVRHINDQATEFQGRAINAAEDHAWQAVDAAQTAAAQVDGAAASVAPAAARQLAGHGVPVVAYSAPAVVAPAVVAPAVVAPAFAVRDVAKLLVTAPSIAPVAYAVHGFGQA